jgi:sugar phosphate isomerase/epimerase
MSKPIAIQVYSVRDAAEADLDATLKALKEYGYDGIELAGLYGNSPETVRDLCKKYGLDPISAHVSYKEMMAGPDKLFADYATIGCKYVAIPSLPSDRIPGGEKFSETVELIKAFSAAAKNNGIQLLYHNHDFEFETVGGEYKLDIMYKIIPEGVLDTELDTCWVNVGGEDPAEYIKKYAGRTPVVHLKDFFGEKSDDMYELIGEETKPKRPGGFEFRPVGHGLQNFPAILAAAEAAGAEWVVVEQDKPSMDLTSMECAKASIEYLKSIMD